MQGFLFVGNFVGNNEYQRCSGELGWPNIIFSFVKTALHTVAECSAIF